MQRIKATDTNGRTFTMLTEDYTEVTQEWIDKQSDNREKYGHAGRNTRIVSWSVERI